MWKAAMLACVTCVAAWTPAMTYATMPQRCTRRTVIVAAQRYDEPILDESLPDPVYDDEFKYKGYSMTGFVDFAETLNGRAAMMGFTILFLQELIFGKGVLEMYGLPYDPGAVLQ